MFDIQVFALLFLTNIFYYDYIYLTQTILNGIKNGYSIPAECLNKFNLGIHQYYLSLAYKKFNTKAKSYIPTIEFYDPISLPNATALGEPNFYFYEAQVFGFPGFMQNYELFGEPGRDLYLQHLKIDFLSKSDVIIFTGYFNVFRADYFFVYHLKKNILKSTRIKLRSNNGMIVTKKIKDYLTFSAEQLIHTYDSGLCIFNETRRQRYGARAIDVLLQNETDLFKITEL